MAKRKIRRPSLKVKQRLQEKVSEAKILRRAGLLSKKSVPRITPKAIRSNRNVAKLRNQFADVISGRARTAKVGKKAAAQYKAVGFKTRGERVIVPLKTAERVYARAHKIIISDEIKGRRRVIEQTGQQRQLPPRPPRSTGGSGGNEFEDCLRKLKEWFLENAETYQQWRKRKRGGNVWYPGAQRASASKRWEQVERIARANPAAFLRVVNAYHQRGMQYLAGQKPDNTRVRGWEVFEKHNELFYYHPTSSDSTISGGVIPKC